MADFYAAIKTVLKNEGGFVDDLLDYGGATNFGISLDFYKNIDPNATKVDIENLTEQMAEEIYLKSFWIPNKYNMIADQKVATKVFDFAVNMGEENANKCLQRAVLAASERNLDLDGIIGTASLFAVNHSDPNCVYAALKSEGAGFYRLDVALYPSKKKYLNGWLIRAYSDVL